MPESPSPVPPDEVNLLAGQLTNPHVLEVELSSPALDRLRKAINCLISNSEYAPSTMDLAVLTRQALGRISQKLYVPKRDDAWPTREQWESVGVEVIDWGETFLLEWAPWKPEWLSTTGNQAVGESVVKEITKREYASVPGDPFLEQIGRESYRSNAQRTSVRQALMCRPGCTLAICLPTGEGKSFVFQALSKMGLNSNDNVKGTTLIILPTVALISDQERSYRELEDNIRNSGDVQHNLKYVGSMSPEEKSMVRDQIRNGSQGICLTGPESTCQSLLPSLKEAAKAGYLKGIVIDEAHLVETWGGNFRSAFQSLSGVVRELMALCPVEKRPRVLLMSATLTSNSLQVLKTLFPGRDELDAPSFSVVSAQRLRGEIEYWAANTSSPTVRLQRLQEAMLHVPRPAIVYVSKVVDSRTLSQNLRDMGFKRVGWVTGKTTESAKNEAIRAWRAGELDIVIGTSAFGLGIDNPNVRTVIHACIPETIDRFYQEAGRGGRDGRATMSIIIPAESDFSTAGRLNSAHLIGREKGLKRWSAMLQQAIPENDFVFDIKIDIPPGSDQTYIDMVGDWSREWNNRVLTLLANAEIIQLLAPNSEIIREDSDEETIRQAIQIDHYQRVRILDTEFGSGSEESWDKKVLPTAQRIYRNNQLSLDYMHKYLDKNECIGNILSDAYTVPNFDVDIEIPVKKICGGCPFCRTDSHNTLISTNSPVTVSSKWIQPISEIATRFLDRSNRVVILYPNDLSNRQFARWRTAIGKLATMGIHNLRVINSNFMCAKKIQEDIKWWPIFFSKSLISDPLPPGAKITLISPDYKIEKEFFSPETEEYPHFIFMPEDTPDFEIPTVPFRERYNGRIRFLDQFIQRINR